MTPFLRKLGVTLVNPYHQSPFEQYHRNDPDDGESTSCQMQDIKYCFRQYVQSNALINLQSSTHDDFLPGSEADRYKDLNKVTRTPSLAENNPSLRTKIILDFKPVRS